MGRPLNKRNFGAPTTGGNEMKVQFHNGSASVAGYIVKQKGTKKFLCSDGTTEAICFLVDKASGALAAGEMTITVKDDAAAVKQVTKIAAHKATIDTGESIGWTFDDSAADAKVEMEEAGLTGAASLITAGAFVIGVEYVIVTPGTTDFTLIGAADSLASTVFTASGAGVGTGTARTTANAAGDDFEGDDI